MTYHAQTCYKVRPIGCKLTPDPTMPSDPKYRAGPTRIYGPCRWLSGALILGALLLVLTGGANAQTKSRDVSQLNKQLFSAVRADQDARVRSLLTAGADPVAVNAVGLTPAGLAIERGNFKMAHYILSVRNQRVLAKERADERRREAFGQVSETVATSPTAPKEAAPIPASQAATPHAPQPVPPAPAAAPPPGHAVAASGGRIPFDPLAAASADLPTLKITEATGAGQTLKPASERAQAAPNSERSEPGLLGRMVGGTTGVFRSDETAQAHSSAPASVTAEVVARAAPVEPTANSSPVDETRVQIRRMRRTESPAAQAPTPKPMPASVPAPKAVPETLQTARVSAAGPAVADEPGLFGRITGGITDGIAGIFSSDPEPADNKIDSAAAPPASVKEQPPGDTESGVFGRMMEGIANVVGAGTEETAAPDSTAKAAPENTAETALEKTAETAPEKAGGETTVISSFFKNMFASGETETPSDKPEVKAENKVGSEPKPELKPEPEIVVRSAPDAEAPKPAPEIGLKLPTAQVADATLPKVEATPPETKATLPETKATPAEATTQQVETNAVPAKDTPPETKPAPFSAAGSTASPLPTISDPNLTASAKTQVPVKPAPARVAADERSGLDKFLRRLFTEPDVFAKREPEEAPKEAPAPETETAGAGDGPSVESFAAATGVGDGNAQTETPKTVPGQSISSKIDGFFKGLATGFGGKSKPGETAITETTGAAPPMSDAAAEPAPEPAKRSKLDRFVRGLFKAKPKTAGADETIEIAEAATPLPAPESKTLTAKAERQASTKITELASRPATSRRRLGQGGGRRRAEAIPFIPAVTLTVGETLTLGRTLSDATSRAANCFQKGKNAGWYCLETADWPGEIRERLRVSTWIYRNAMTIVHYRSGRAQRIFSVFPAKNFNKVVRFLEAKFGPPAEETEQFIALVGAPPKLNLRVKWKRKNADGSISALEVRKFDNVRRMVPDTNIGFIRLYREGSRPIFRTINESDLMLQSLRNSRLR
jgi:hypothetical protein